MVCLQSPPTEPSYLLSRLPTEPSNRDLLRKPRGKHKSRTDGLIKEWQEELLTIS